MAKECNVPGCEKPGKFRGLCDKHYWRMMRSANPTAKAEAARYADPPKRKGRSKPRPPVDGEQAGPGPQPTDGTGVEPPAGRKIADAVIAAVCEFATAAGIMHAPYQGGRLFLSDRWGERALTISETGRLRWLELRQANLPIGG